MSPNKNQSNQKSPTKEMCFVIMPISDVDTHPKGHFTHVYKDIISPACEEIGFTAHRADDVKAANLIQLDILKQLIDAPIAVCDLSTRNPNVLFELGIRQAFDKPVVLIQELGTPRIFDISGIRYLEYSKEMKYHEVLKTQKELSQSLRETIEANSKDNNINSIVKLLSLSSSAKLPELQGSADGFAFDVIQTEMRSLRRQMQNLFRLLSDQSASQSLSSNTASTSFSEEREWYITQRVLTLEKDILSIIYSDLDQETKYKQIKPILSELEIIKFETQDTTPHSLELRDKIKELITIARQA